MNRIECTVLAIVIGSLYPSQLAAPSPNLRKLTAIGGEVRPQTELKPESRSSMSGSLSLLITALLIRDPEP
jgi:hypothetical protein